MCGRVVNGREPALSVGLVELSTVRALLDAQWTAAHNADVDKGRSCSYVRGVA